MTVFWYHVRPEAGPRPLVILDVSTAAAGLWPILTSTLEGLAEELPDLRRPDVAFLGGSDRYSYADFARRTDALYAANAGRGRVISPTLEALGDDWPTRVVVIAANPIVDLGDWFHPPFDERLAVVSLDPSVPIAGEGRDVYVGDLDMATLATHVSPKAIQLRITVAGGLPVAWTNLAYRFDEARLTADNTDAGAVVTGWFCPSASEEPPLATAERTWDNGRTTAVDVTSADASAESDWLPFTGAELTPLNAWRRRQPAGCDQCHGDHPPGQVACATGNGTLLPSLAGRPRGFVRVRMQAIKGSYQFVPNAVAVLGPESAAVLPPDDGPAGSVAVRPGSRAMDGRRHPRPVRAVWDR